MKIKLLVFFAVAACAYAADVKDNQDKVEPEQNKDKRQTQGDFYPSYQYRSSRNQEPVSPVEEQQDDGRVIISSRADNNEYRPGQVFSLDPRELLELQPERKAPLASSQQLQQLYTSPQQDYRQNLQPVYFLESQTGRQVGTPPRIGASTVAPLSNYQQPQQIAPIPQQSIQQLLHQALGGQQVGAQSSAPTNNPAPPLSGNQPLHQLSNYPQQNQRDYLQQLINLHALLSRYNAAPNSPAPPRYPTFAPQYQTQAPQNQAPQYETQPQNQVPQYQPPQYQTQAPQNQVPQYQAPQYQTQAPQNQVPQYQSPQYQTHNPQYQAPQYHTQNPQYQAPQYQTQNPQYQPPQYQTQNSQYQPPQYQTQNSQYQPPQYQTQNPQYRTSQIIGNLPTQQPNYEPQNDRQFQSPGGPEFSSSTPGPFEFIGSQNSQQESRNTQGNGLDGRYDQQQLNLLQALAKTPPLTQPPYSSTQSLRQFYEDSQNTESSVVLIGSNGRSLSTTASPQFETKPVFSNQESQQSVLRPASAYSTSTYRSTPQTLRQFYEDSQRFTEKPVVFIGSTERSLKPDITTPGPQLETSPIPSNKQLQELDSTQNDQTPEQKFKDIYLINALQEKQSPSTHNVSLGGSTDVTSRLQTENNTTTTSNPVSEDEEVGSHAVIARPHYSSNGGEASVGAALSVSDTGINPSDSFDQELLALLSQKTGRPDSQAYQQTASVASQYQQVAQQTVAPQYQQVDRYITKPSKKPTKLHPKVHSHVSPPQSSAAPQQYLIETTNVQQQPQQQYRLVPQSQRPSQALGYVTVPSSQAFAQQSLYEQRPESQGLKVVAAPKLQQARPQLGYRLLQTYQQPEATPKQYRILDAPKAQTVRPDQRVPAPSIERPVTYLNRYPATEKMRAVKIYDPVPQDGPQQSAPLLGEQYYLRPVYRTNDQRYQSSPSARPVEAKTPHSSIYVSKNLAPKKVKSQSLKVEQTSSSEHAEEPRGQSIEERRAQLPPPKNNRAYTPEEFAALVAAGYSVTPIPVAPIGHPGHPVHPVAESRASLEKERPAQRRPLYSRRHQHLHLSGDDAP